ncbi:MAG TPA: DUF2905 domain-containing protein [Actinomycetota bacterium]|nr:DUF2905 domain-containing protein [Actinomycetota bacterium]
MTARSFGTLLIGLGLAIAALGLLLTTGLLGWFGRLPGDIRIEGESTRVYIPLTSMILISAAVTVVLNLVRRLL